MARTDHTLAHHLRFARTLALLSGIGASTAGCYAAHAIDGDRGRGDSAAPDSARPDGAMRDSALLDGPPIADAGRDSALTCETCQCPWESPPPDTSCDELGLHDCCAAIGPLSPPDLAA